jgi:hypothetical protein
MAVVSVLLGEIGTKKVFTLDVGAEAPTRDAPGKAGFEGTDALANVPEGAARPCAFTALLKGGRAGRRSRPPSRLGRRDEGQPHLSTLGQVSSRRTSLPG